MHSPGEPHAYMTNDDRSWSGAAHASMPPRNTSISRPSRRGKYVQRACAKVASHASDVEPAKQNASSVIVTPILPSTAPRTGHPVFRQGRLDTTAIEKRGKCSTTMLKVDTLTLRRRDWDGDHATWQTRSERPPFDAFQNTDSLSISPGKDNGNVVPDTSPMNLDGDDAQTMVGELSAFNSLNARDANSERDADEDVPDIANGETNPPPMAATTTASPKHAQGWLLKVIDSHQISPSRDSFDGLLRLFFDLAHSFYPLLHPPWVWQIHEEMWRQAFHRVDDNFLRDLPKRLSVGMVFLCLAVGACQEPSTMDPEAKSPTNGHNLYGVAMELLQPFLDLTQDQPVTVQSVQALGLIALYLIRIDALGKAERIIGLAVSSAHILGLQCQSTRDCISFFDDQMRRRVFWSLYGLDRRLSVETGRPLRIDDTNVSTIRPLNLSDRFLERARVSKKRSADIIMEIEPEVASCPQTSIPFLNGAISYGKIIGSLWNDLYGAKNVSLRTQPNPGLAEVLDVLIEHDKRQLPPQLTYDRSVPFDDHFKNQAPWQVKLTILTHMRHNFLRLIIRRSSYVLSGPLTDKGQDVVGQARCAQIAAEIVEDYARIPPAYARHTFPLVHHLTSATMILFSIVMRSPVLAEVCRAPIVAGVEALIADSSKTWISGKLRRTITRLDEMVRSGLLSPPRKPLTRGPSKRAEASSGPTGSGPEDLGTVNGFTKSQNYRADQVRSSSRRSDDVVRAYPVTPSGSLPLSNSFNCEVTGDKSDNALRPWTVPPAALGITNTTIDENNNSHHHHHHHHHHNIPASDAMDLLQQHQQTAGMDTTIITNNTTRDPHDNNAFSSLLPWKDAQRWLQDGFGFDTMDNLLHSSDTSYWMTAADGSGGGGGNGDMNTSIY